MNPDQTALYDRAGELARQYHELKRRHDEAPATAFHGAFFLSAIEAGFDEQPLDAQIVANPRIASLAHRMGLLARVTRIWKDDRAMVHRIPGLY
jgi:hypothetical protein